MYLLYPSILDEYYQYYFHNYILLIYNYKRIANLYFNTCQSDLILFNIIPSENNRKKIQQSLHLAINHPTILMLYNYQTTNAIIHELKAMRTILQTNPLNNYHQI